MKVRVLGCSGGISQNVATTSFLVDDDILIDAGTGVCDLTLDEMRCIRHIFLTHSHLDHITAIPLLTDTLFDDLIGNPVTVYALPETIDALQKHMFNWAIWPDFTVLPDTSKQVLKLETIDAGSITEIGHRRIEAIAVNHTVPGVGYCVECSGKRFVFSGDTTTNDSLWERLNEYESLDLLFVETAFADEDLELSRTARHYCPQLLAADIIKLKHQVTVHLTHFKPGSEHAIFEQCKSAMPEIDLVALKTGDTFQL